MGGMPSMLSSQQPGKDSARAGEEGENSSPASSPNKRSAGETYIQLTTISVAEVGAPGLN